MKALLLGATAIAVGLCSFSPAFAKGMSATGESGADGQTSSSGTITLAPPLTPLLPPPVVPPLPAGDPPQLSVPLKDIVYFGAAWISLEMDGPSADFVLGNGWANPEVTRDTDGSYMWGTIEKLDASGRVTDVVMAFTGTRNGTRDDLTDSLMQMGIEDAQLLQAEAKFDALMTNPRYANARIHLTGHSMGGAIPTWLIGYSIKTYGISTTRQRVLATVFANPPWGDGVLARFALNKADFAGLIHNYFSATDIVANGTGTVLGTQHMLPPYQPWLDNTPLAPITGVALGHAPIAVIQGLGLPDWLTPAQYQTVENDVADDGAIPLTTLTSHVWDPTYGPDGTVPQQITGTIGADWIVGGVGADVIDGGGGADIMVGGPGADHFLFKAGESPAGASVRILDFSQSDGDKIDLRPLDADPATQGIDRFTFVGSGMPAVAGQVGFYWAGNDTIVFAKANGSDTIITLTGHYTLTAADFLT